MAGSTISFTIERAMRAGPASLYRTWTERFDTWFATPGRIRMDPVEGRPYWFEVIHEGVRHPHYGRFLTLAPDALIEQTWVTGRGGTEGAETVVRIEFLREGSGTRLRLTHSGFPDTASARNHEDSWPPILARLDDAAGDSG